MSEGNGHPYSWSSIFNGYDPDYMADCPFPAIPEYLAHQNFPEDAIRGAQVTHIWTQTRELSNHIAQCAQIESVVTNLPEMVSEVDAVLLARDDSENHFAMAEPFIEAGLPIYIDKPLAILSSEAESIYKLEQSEGQIFTCSALAYADEFKLSESELAELGSIQSFEAHVSDPWETYAIHIIEPVLKLIGENSNIEAISANHEGNGVEVAVKWDNQITGTFTADPDSEDPIAIRIFGESGQRELIFVDSFNAFKSALQEFVEICNGEKENLSKEITLKCVEIIEQGL